MLTPQFLFFIAHSMAKSLKMFNFQLLKEQIGQLFFCKFLMSAMVAIASSDIRIILFSNFVLVYRGAQYE